MEEAMYCNSSPFVKTVLQHLALQTLTNSDYEIITFRWGDKKWNIREQTWTNGWKSAGHPLDQLPTRSLPAHACELLLTLKARAILRRLTCLQIHTLRQDANRLRWAWTQAAFITSNVRDWRVRPWSHPGVSRGLYSVQMLALKKNVCVGLGCER